MATINEISIQMTLVAFVKAASNELNKATDELLKGCEADDLVSIKNSLDNIINITKIDNGVIAAFAADAVEAGCDPAEIDKIKTAYYDFANDVITSSIKLVDGIIAINS